MIFRKMNSAIVDGSKVIMDCPICTEESPELDILMCGHRVHKECVKKSADAMQDKLVKEGYPARTCARCPLCRANLPDIPVKLPVWLGSIEITKDTMQALIDILKKFDGWVSEENIPTEILDQLPNASREDQLNIVNCAAIQLWLIRTTQLPQKMRLTRFKPCVFSYRYQR